MTLRVSVVVPTYKRPYLLERCLAALAVQTLDPAEFEIVVADDGPTADTRAMVEQWARRTSESGGPALRYMPVDGPHGPAAARNRGWRAARGDVIAFTDDDTIPAPDWLAEGLSAFGPGTTAAWGAIEMPLPPVPTDYELDASGLARAEFVTANCFCRKQALAEVGGFDERFRLAWREDSDLFFNLARIGARIEHAPRARVVHPVRPAPWGVSISQQKKSLFDALLFKKHPDLYRRKIGGAPWHYYGIVLSLGVAAGGWAAGAKPVAAGGGALWLLLTGRFCLKRLQRTSRAPRHVAEMVVTSAVIPVLSVFWRLVGAVKFRVPFV